MFVGSVPRQVVTQLAKVVPVVGNDRVFVCCSGAFRVDTAIKEIYPSATVSGNDVSLLSCALGALLTGRTLDFSFTNDLAFVEPLLVGEDFKTRIAALLVAMDALKFNRKTDYGRKHWEHYVDNFPALVVEGLDGLDRHYSRARLDSFFAGDFRDQAARARDCDGLVLAFPPTYKGGYERLYKKLSENTAWTEPDYRLWDPALIGEWIGELAAAGQRFCVFVDHEVEGRTAVAKFIAPRAHPIYLYASDSRGTSYRTRAPRAEPFRYTAVDPATITRNSHLSIVRIESAHLNFLRNKYLAKNIDFVDATYCYAVYLDGCLVGGFGLARSKFGGLDSLYLLADFSIRPERRLAKLVAMVAASRPAVHEAEIKMLSRIEWVYTTAFTDRPVSMKYRGIYELVSRKPGMLNYRCQISPDALEAVFHRWYDRWAGADPDKAGGP